MTLPIVVPLIVPMHGYYSGTLDPHAFGWLLLGLLGYFVWGSFVFWVVSGWFDLNMGLLLAGIIGVPLFIGGVYFLSV